MAKTLTKDQVIALMKRRQGSRQAKDFAIELGISKQYLSDVYAGRREIGPAIAEALGLRCELRFVIEAA